MVSVQSIYTRLILRPPKIVTFIDENIPNWKKAIVEIIELYSEIWGGALDLIVPYSLKDDSMVVDEIFVDILRAYDADIYLLYEDFNYQNINYWYLVYSLLRPFLRRNHLSFLATYYIESKEKIRGLAKNHGFYIDTGVLKRKLKNYEFSLISYEQKDSDDIDFLSLIVYSVLGKYSEERLKELETAGINVNKQTTKEIMESDILNNLFIWDVQDELTSSYGEVFGKYPFLTTLVETKLSNISEDFTDIVISGEGVKEFLLFYNLFRLNLGLVVFINKEACKNSFYENFVKRQLSFIYSSYNKVFEYPKEKEKELEMNTLLLKDIYSEQLNYYSLLRENQIHLATNFDAYKYIRKSLSPILTYQFDNYILPNSLFNEYWAKRTSENGFHVRLILTEIPHYDAFEIFKNIFQEKETSVFESLASVDERLKYSEENLFLSFSDKGKYFNYIYEKLFGKKLSNLKEFFNSPECLSLFFFFAKLGSGKFKKVKFLAQKMGLNNDSIEKIAEDKGVKIDHRSYFSAEEMVAMYEQLGYSSSDTKSFKDFLVEKNILHRGFVLKCKYCGDKPFYYLESIGKNGTFICKRCNLKQSISSENILRSYSDLIVFYSLNEIMFQFIENDGLLPLFTLFKLKSLSNQQFQFSPEFKIVSEEEEIKEILEVDIACIIDSHIVMGECKSNNNGWTEKEVDKLKAIASIFECKNIVLSTFEKKKPSHRQVVRRLVDDLEEMGTRVIELDFYDFQEV